MAINDAETNSAHTNGTSHNGLKVVVIGAGLGGLSAAIALRQQGHEVVIFESSKFATELGAAIHIPPNAHGLLKRLGISPGESGANPCSQITTYAPNGHKVNSVNTVASGKIWQHPWLLAHRVKMHNALKETAIRLGAQLNLGKAVKDVDSEGTIILSDESKHHADVVVGADGVHSITRSKVVPGHPKPFSSGKSAFRFLVPRKALLDDLRTRHHAEQTGELLMVIGEDRRLIMYPTSDNSLLNFVCIHPESDTSYASSSDWSNTATREMLLSVYKDFHPDFLAILSKADEASLKVWRLMDMEVLPSWTKGRIVLLGDAAHPFLPHQGQGAAVAIEDAASLGMVLDRDILAHEVPERLQLYQDIRKARADTLQEYTRIAGKDMRESGGMGPAVMQKFMAFNFGHDEFDNSAQRLREWKWAQEANAQWRTPISFGPIPRPRRNFESGSREQTQSIFWSAFLKFKTSRTVLQNLFPPGSKSWRFKSPGTVAFCSFSQTTFDGVDWLGGSDCSQLCLYIHGTEFVSDDGTVIDGAFMPIVFENLTDTIISGRCDFDMPKMYSAIDVVRNTDSYSITASWRDHIWGRFELKDLQQEELGITAESSMGQDIDEQILVQTCMPSLDDTNNGAVDAKCVVLNPFNTSIPKPQPERVSSTTNARFAFDAGTTKSLPTLHHIVERLAEIPICEVVTAKVVSGTGVPDMLGARRT